jgi:hypothetical protein
VTVGKGRGVILAAVNKQINQLLSFFLYRYTSHYAR